MNKNQKSFEGFWSFDSKESNAKLAEKKALEFPRLNTFSEGKITLYRQIKWEQINYRGRDFEIPVIACENSKGKKGQITLASLFGKAFPFVVDREANGKTRGAKFVVNNLLPFDESLSVSASDRNTAVMAKITDGLEITLSTWFGHYDQEGARSNTFTFVNVD